MSNPSSVFVFMLERLRKSSDEGAGTGTGSGSGVEFDSGSGAAGTDDSSNVVMVTLAYVLLGSGAVCLCVLCVHYMSKSVTKWIMSRYSMGRGIKIYERYN